MTRLVHKRIGLALGCAWLAAAAAASDAPPQLEELLRLRRPDVSRWQVQPLAAKGVTPAGDIIELGRIGARTPVRFADGHVHWYAVAGFRDVLVSAHVIEGGTLASEDARLESRDVLVLGCEPFIELATPQRWRAQRRLAAGEVLCSSTIEPAPEVERNRAVTLSAQRGGIQVSRVLIAANDARAGDRVRLRDDANGVTVVGIVTGPGAARIAGETK